MGTMILYTKILPIVVKIEIGHLNWKGTVSFLSGPTTFNVLTLKIQIS